MCAYENRTHAGIQKGWQKEEGREAERKEGREGGREGVRQRGEGLRKRCKVGRGLEGCRRGDRHRDRPEDIRAFCNSI